MLPDPTEGGLVVPEPLEQRYRLFSRALGEGTLNRLLLLHAVMSSSLRVSLPGALPLLSAVLALGDQPSCGKLSNPTSQAAWSQRPLGHCAGRRHKPGSWQFCARHPWAPGCWSLAGVL